ncbi:MAG: Nif3-like dinuclear metal center hexameric protein [Clostridia bacterium]|nr:Nif3-like dinuclear metal center hexameric protein [Clostridia bacterium]
MKIIDLCRELTDGITLPFDIDATCDRIKVGNENGEIKKVGTAMFATPEVLREASRRGINLLIVHEPMFYEHTDFHRTLGMAPEKEKLAEELGITVFRYHDYAHAREGDLIREGELKLLGLPVKSLKHVAYGVAEAELEKGFAARELAMLVKKKLGLATVKLAGDADAVGCRAALCFGTPGRVVEELETCDFVLTGEICEWAEGELVRDYGQMGVGKALLVLGHIGSERGGMMLLAEELKTRHPEFETVYIECGELYEYV